MPLELYLKKDTVNADGSVVNNNTTPTDQIEKPENIKGETNNVKKMIAAQVVSYAKQGMNMAIRNYGDITGRAREQQAIETGINVAGVVATFASAGPIIGSAVLVAQSAISVGQSFINQNLQNRQIDFNNRRMGDIINGGNR